MTPKTPRERAEEVSDKLIDVCDGSGCPDLTLVRRNVLWIESAIKEAESEAYRRGIEKAAHAAEAFSPAPTFGIRTIEEAARYYKSGLIKAIRTEIEKVEK